VYLNQRRVAIRKEILESADIVASTLSSSGQSLLVDHISEHKITFDTVIVDEAGQTTEPATLIPLRYGCRRLVLVGDARQLPAYVCSKVAERAGLGVSLFERLERSGHEIVLLTVSLPSRTSPSLSFTSSYSSDPPSSLPQVQYRMHPEIRRFPSSEFYSNKLRDAQRITLEVEQFNSGTLDEEKKKRVVADFIKVDSRAHLNPVMFFDLASREETHGKSFRNPIECRFLFSFLSFLAPLLRGFTIGIVTPYKSQVDLIRREIHSRRDAASSSSSSVGVGVGVEGSADQRVWRELLIDVNTVDGYQGKEKDLIILSTVRTRSIGFLADQRRLNVAITRAKRCLIVIGCERVLCGDPVWGRMIADLRERRGVHQAASDDFKSYGGYKELRVGIFGPTEKGGGVSEDKEKQRRVLTPSPLPVPAPGAHQDNVPRRDNKDRERKARGPSEAVVRVMEEGELLEEQPRGEKRRGDYGGEASAEKKSRVA
jgi:senataxin